MDLVEKFDVKGKIGVFYYVEVYQMQQDEVDEVVQVFSCSYKLVDGCVLDFLINEKFRIVQIGEKIYCV